jgi:DNA-binding IclR family transcriptional regulator
VTNEGSLTLERGLALLQAVADSDGQAVTVSEVAVAIGASRAAVYRLLVPLVERGLLRREGTRIRLGVGVLRLADQVLPQLREVSQPIVRVLVEEIGVTVALSIVEGDYTRVIAAAEPSQQDLHISWRVGSRLPLAVGAAGRAMTLRQDDAGWISTVGEPAAGVYSIAAPVRGIPGFRASLAVISLAPLNAEQIGSRLVKAAIELAGLVK